MMVLAVGEDALPYCPNLALVQLSTAARPSIVSSLGAAVRLSVLIPALPQRKD